MKDLSTLRQDLKTLDDQIVSLITKRLVMADAVADAKIAAHLPVTDPARERAESARSAGRAGRRSRFAKDDRRQREEFGAPINARKKRA